MSGFLSHFACCFWWFLLGALVGWLLNRLLCKCCSKSCTAEKSTDANALESSQTNTMGLVSDSTTNVASTTKASASNPGASAKKAAEPKATKKATSPKVAAKPTASKTSSTGSLDVAAAKAAGFAIKTADDLTVIEGIGPKINELFKANGVVTFDDLSKQTVAQMRTILDAGGARFRIADPSTWAEQATLASKNDWVALKKLQDALSGGIRK